MHRLTGRPSDSPVAGIFRTVRAMNVEAVGVFLQVDVEELPVGGYLDVF